MELPESIKIGPYICRIKIAEDSLTKNSVCGYFDHSALEIKIGSSDLHPICLLDTLLHECLHGLFMLSGESGSEETEEQIVSFLTPHLLMLFRQNPKLMKLLLQYCQGKLDHP